MYERCYPKITFDKFNKLDYINLLEFHVTLVIFILWKVFKLKKKEHRDFKYALTVSKLAKLKFMLFVTSYLVDLIN